MVSILSTTDGTHHTPNADTEHREVTDFVACLHLKNLASSTIEGYRLALRGLFEYIHLGASAPSEITTAQLRRYVASLYDRGLAPKTIKNYVVGIKRFFGFLLVEGYIEDEVVFDGVAPLVHNKFEAHHSNDAVVVRHQVVEESGIAVTYAGRELPAACGPSESSL